MTRIIRSLHRDQTSTASTYFVRSPAAKRAADAARQAVSQPRLDRPAGRQWTTAEAKQSQAASTHGYCEWPRPLVLVLAMAGLDRPWLALDSEPPVASCG